MAKCPVCETRTVDHWIRGFLIAIFLGLLVGFIGGQLFHSWQYGRLAEKRIGLLEEKKDELVKGYVPPRESPTKEGGKGIVKK